MEASVSTKDVEHLLAEVHVDPAGLPEAPLCTASEDVAHRAQYERHHCRICQHPGAARPVLLDVANVGPRWLDLCPQCWPVIQHLLYRPNDAARLVSELRADPASLPPAPPDADGNDLALRAEYENHHPCRGCGQPEARCPVVLQSHVGSRWIDLCERCHPVVQRALQDPPGDRQ